MALRQNQHCDVRHAVGSFSWAILTLAPTFVGLGLVLARPARIKYAFLFRNRLRLHRPGYTELAATYPVAAAGSISSCAARRSSASSPDGQSCSTHDHSRSSLVVHRLPRQCSVLVLQLHRGAFGAVLSSSSMCTLNVIGARIDDVNGIVSALDVISETSPLLRSFAFIRFADAHDGGVLAFDRSSAAGRSFAISRSSARVDLASGQGRNVGIVYRVRRSADPDILIYALAYANSPRMTPRIRYRSTLRPRSSFQYLGTT